MLEGKNKIFEIIIQRIDKILNETNSRDACLQAVCELLHREVDYYNWVGFYLVDPKNRRELVLGPFIGEPTEHVRIPFGRGICGQAAEREETFVIQDVTKETNYLSCSLKVKSEIVVPIFKDGKIMGELDIDSHQTSPFSKVDRQSLEKICEMITAIIFTT
jgi:L-methionine (R)-S-oxide reductase